MEQHLLKSRLQEAIAGRKVAAAVFHTFNFEPAFFENYVLPLLVPSQDRFTNDPIANQILWRECIRNDEMPKVTVYCDDFAKNNAEAPMLGYEVRCIRLPEAKNAICNFHPKHIFILLENDELIIATGSGNLTQAGWCSNVEGFHVEVFEKPFGQRPFGQKGRLQRLTDELSGLAGKEPSQAELLISDRSLRYFSPDPASKKALQLWYFTNLDGGFREFLEDFVFYDSIDEVEIISPYFSHSISHIDFFKEMGVEKFRFLLPVSGNDILMEKETYDLLSDAGATWHTWQNEELRGRLNHAKIYRFYGEQATFTIVGSVNFTTPAWEAFDPENNRANIEAAILHDEDPQPRLLAAKPYDISGMRFVQKKNSENAAEWMETWQQRDKPDIQFTIDWQAKKLKATFFEKINTDLRFSRILKQQSLLKKHQTFDLDRETLRQLARNCIIEIEDVDSGAIHVYYANHEHFEEKPLPFRLSATSILQYWDKLGIEAGAAELSRLMADATDEDTGELDATFDAAPSLLNEWALHFSGLVKLEKFLTAPVWRKYEKDEKEKDIKWYLLHTSHDTLPFFLDEMRQQHQEGKLYHSFYWMVLQIAAQNIYGHKWSFLDNETMQKLTKKKKEIEKEAQDVLIENNMAEPEKWEWLCKQITFKT